MNIKMWPAIPADLPLSYTQIDTLTFLTEPPIIVNNPSNPNPKRELVVSPANFIVLLIERI